MNKIVHLSTVHPRFDGRVFQKECCSLANHSFNVSLIVADGNGAETKNNISIIDIGKSKYGRVGRLILKTTQMFFTARKMKACVYHFHDPELLFVGLALKICGYKVIYDIHENLSLQIKHKYWIPSWLRGSVSKLYDVIESFSCKFFDALLVPQPTMKVRYLEKNINTELIANFVDISNLDFSKPLMLNENNQCNLVHAGALADTRGLFNMLDLMGELDENYKLLLAGNFSNSVLKAESLKHIAWNRVDYKGIINIEQIETLYSKSHIGLILYNNVGQYYLSYAIKLFEFMARGIPVIMPNFGEWPEFNKNYQCGICVDVLSPESISTAVKQLHSNPQLALELGNNGRNAIQEKFNWQMESIKLVKVYKGILDVNKL